MPRVRQDPHNALFRFAFRQPEDAGALLRSVLPTKLAKAIDWQTLKRVDAQYAEPAMRETRSDLLFEVRLNREKVFLFVLFEHQSTIEPWMALRLLGYMVRIWEDQRDAKSVQNDEKVGTDRPQKLSPIFPIVLYHGERSWTAPTRFSDLLKLPDEARSLFERALPDFEYALYDLARYTDEELLDRALTALGAAAVGLLRYGKNLRDISRLLQPWLGTFRAVAAAPNGLEAFRAVIRYLSLVSELADTELQRFAREIGPRAEEAYVTHAQRLEREIRKKVERQVAQEVEQRIAQQALEARRSLVNKQLRLRFGELADHGERALKNAGPEQLELWAERLLTANSLDEVIRP